MRRGRAPVLECEAEVPLSAGDIDRAQSLRLALTVDAAELVLLDVRDADHERVLADASCGLVQPLSGAIRFLGRDWRDQTAEYGNALRGRIGHLFRSGGWLPYMSIVDNILLQQLHHTRRAYPVLRDEAARLATRFGLPGLPTGRAAEMGEPDLIRAACVRAFLGTPSLVIVEDVVGEDQDILAPLVEAMREARDRDAAVLWLVQDPRLFRDPTLPATQRLQLHGSELRAGRAELMGEVPTWFRHARRRTGALVLVAVIIFIVAVLQAGVFRDLFRERLTLRVVLPESGLAGLNVGAAVQVLGTDAGQVQEIVIEPTESFHAIVEIDASWEPFVRRNSRVFIRRQFGIAGAAYLEITRGTGEPFDWEFAVLTAAADEAPTESIGSIINELRDKVTPIIADLGRTVRAAGNLVESLQGQDGPLQRTLADLSTVTGRLAQGEGTIGRLLADDTLAEELARIVAGLGARIGEIEAILADVRSATGGLAAATRTVGGQTDRLPAMLDDVTAALTSLRRVMASVDRAMPQVTGLVGEARTATTSLPTVLTQTQQTLAELQRLLVQLQNNWLIGGGAGAAPVQDRSRLSPLEARP